MEVFRTFLHNILKSNPYFPKNTQTRVQWDSGSRLGLCSKSILLNPTAGKMVSKNLLSSLIVDVYFSRLGLNTWSVTSLVYWAVLEESLEYFLDFQFSMWLTFLNGLPNCLKEFEVLTRLGFNTRNVKILGFIQKKWYKGFYAKNVVPFICGKDI